MLKDYSVYLILQTPLGPRPRMSFPNPRRQREITDWILRSRCLPVPFPTPAVLHCGLSLLQRQGKHLEGVCSSLSSQPHKLCLTSLEIFLKKEKARLAIRWMTAALPGSPERNSVLTSTTLAQ